MIDSLRLAASIVLAVSFAATCGACASAPEPHAQASLTSFAVEYNHVSPGSAVEVTRRTGEVTTTSRSSARKMERKNGGREVESFVGIETP